VPPFAAGSEPPSGLPAFPWPPPRYSAFAAIDRGWVAPGPQPTLADVARRLDSAFDATGYVERSYYWIPGGFALVSRIEQIRADASPVDPPARWAVATPRVRDGFLDHLRALFNAAPGFYRVIVFAVTDRDFAAGPRDPTSDEARRWASGGSLRLPAEVGARPYSDRHDTTALIYEFERPADQSPPHVTVPSNSPGRIHLERAGLWEALGPR
jgi:hypothetical protein